MTKLDKFDLKLIAELEKDARQTHSQIAKRLKTSQQVISYRMKQLEKKKVIGGYYTIINLTKLGYTSYRTMIRLSNITSQKHKEITDYLGKNPNVLWIIECGGRWDLIVNFMAQNIIHYDKLLKNFKNRFPEQIQNCDVLTTLEVLYFGRNYFTKTSRSLKLPSFGGEWKTEKIDKKNLEILNLMSENARMSAVEISAKLNISPNTIILRIKEMKRKEIIQGFKPLLHLENTLYEEYKALVKLHNITENKEREIINNLKDNFNVVGVVRIIGLWDFEIEFGTETKHEMLELTRAFRDKFKEVIKDIEIVPLFHEYRYNFFPKDVLI